MMSCIENTAKERALCIVTTEAWRYVVEMLGVTPQGGYWHDALATRWIVQAKTLKRLASKKFEVEQYASLVKESIQVVKRQATYIAALTRSLETEMAVSELYESPEEIERAASQVMDNLLDTYRHAISEIPA